MQLNFSLNFSEYQQHCECADWSAPISTVVFQHRPGCSKFDTETELMIMANKMWEIHQAKLKSSFESYAPFSDGDSILS